MFNSLYCRWNYLKWATLFVDFEHTFWYYYTYMCLLLVYRLGRYYCSVMYGIDFPHRDIWSEFWLRTAAGKGHEWPPAAFGILLIHADPIGKTLTSNTFAPLHVASLDWLLSAIDMFVPVAEDSWVCFHPRLWGWSQCQACRSCPGASSIVSRCNFADVKPSPKIWQGWAVSVCF